MISPGIKITTDSGDQSVTNSKMSVEIPYYKDIKFCELIDRLFNLRAFSLDTIATAVETIKNELDELEELAKYLQAKGHISISVSSESEDEENSMGSHSDDLSH